MIFIEIFKASKIKLIAVAITLGMVRAYCWWSIVVLVITADTIASLIQNKTVRDVNNNLKNIGARRHTDKKPLSTSSESNDHDMSDNQNYHRISASIWWELISDALLMSEALLMSMDDNDYMPSEAASSEVSLDISSVSSSSSSYSHNRPKPKSSEQRRGWRKWHRKCTPCPEDMIKKWRDRSISWICGGYQRARRSFKSECMMYYRNCQDGTMFVKIHDHRCQNDTGTDLRHGLHFFYEYGKDSQDSDASSSDSSIQQISISDEMD